MSKSSKTFLLLLFISGGIYGCNSGITSSTNFGLDLTVQNSNDFSPTDYFKTESNNKFTILVDFSNIQTSGRSPNEAYFQAIAAPITLQNYKKFLDTRYDNILTAAEKQSLMNDIKTLMNSRVPDAYQIVVDPALVLKPVLRSNFLNWVLYSVPTTNSIWDARDRYKSSLILHTFYRAMNAENSIHNGNWMYPNIVRKTLAGHYPYRLIGFFTVEFKPFVKNIISVTPVGTFGTLSGHNGYPSKIESDQVRLSSLYSIPINIGRLMRSNPQTETESWISSLVINGNVRNTRGTFWDNLSIYDRPFYTAQHSIIADNTNSGDDTLSISPFKQAASSIALSGIDSKDNQNFYLYTFKLTDLDYLDYHDLKLFDKPTKIINDNKVCTPYQVTSIVTNEQAYCSLTQFTNGPVQYTLKEKFINQTAMLENDLTIFSSTNIVKNLYLLGYLPFVISGN